MRAQREEGLCRVWQNETTRKSKMVWAWGLLSPDSPINWFYNNEMLEMISDHAKCCTGNKMDL